MSSALHIEHFLFFPVVVLLALVLIVLSWKLLVRLFAFFLLVMALWYLVYLAGVVSSPYEVLRQSHLRERSEIEHEKSTKNRAFT